MPDLSTKVLNVKAEVKAEFKWHSWGQTCQTEFQSKNKYLPHHRNSQRCAAAAVVYASRLFASNNQSWEPGRVKWLDRLGKDRLGKAPAIVTWGLPPNCRRNFNEERNMALVQYFLNFRSESTRHSFYKDTVFNSPELHADEIFNTLPLIKVLVYKYLFL